MDTNVAALTPPDNAQGLDFNVDNTVGPVNEPTLDFFPTADVTPRNPSLVASRAMMAHYALGVDSPGLPALNESMSTTLGETTLRQYLAEADSGQQIKTKNEMIQTVAANKGSDLTTSEMGFLQQLAQYTPTVDPQTVLERRFAGRYVGSVMTNNPSPNSVVAQADTDLPPAYKNVAADQLHDVTTKRELFRKTLQDLHDEMSNESLAGKAVDVASSFLPFFNTAVQYFPSEPGVGASNMRARARYTWSLPIEDAAKTFTDDVNSIKKYSLSAAAEYANTIFGMADSEVGPKNIGLALDVATVGAPLAAKAAGKLGNLVKSAIGGLSDEPINLKNAYAAIGDVEKAAQVGAIQKARNVLTARDPLIQGIDLSDDLPLMMNPASILKKRPGQIATEAENRLVASLQASAKKSADIAFAMQRIDRLPPETVQVMLRTAKQMFPTEFPRTTDGIIQMDLIPAERVGSNTNFMNVIIGKRDATLFKSEDEANNYALHEYGLNLDRYTTGKGTFPEAIDQNYGTVIRQQGDGWYIQISKPLDEVDPLARASIAIPTNNKNPGSLANTYLGAVRGAREVLPEFQTANRAVTTMIPNQVRKMIFEMAAPLKLRKASYNRLMGVLDEDLAFTDYATQQHGMRSYSQHDLEQRWMRINNNTLPTEKESLAYWTYHQIMETDLAIRNMGLHRDLSRLAIEHYSFPHAVDQATGDMIQSPYFYGKFQRNVDWESKQNWGVWVQEGPVGKFYYKLPSDADLKAGNSNASNLKAYIDHLVQNENYQVIQIPNYTDRPLKDLTGDGRLINYIISKGVESRPLPMRLVDKTDGVHVIYPHPFKTVQARMQPGDHGRMNYYGDQTIMLHYTDQDARAAVQRLEKLRDMFKRNVDEVTIRKYVEKELPMDFDHWKKEFGQDGRLSLDVPVSATRLNVPAMDTDMVLKKMFQNVEDHTKSPMNIFRQVDHSFLQDRDLPAIQGELVKSGDSAIYKVQRAETLNPMAALQKGVSNAMKSLHMNDMKISAIEQWASQYSDLSRNPELARLNPLNFFFNEADEALVKGDNFDKYLQAKWTRQRIKQFIGQQTELGQTLRWTEQKLFNMMPHGAAKWFAVHDYPLLKDPTSYIRSAMMHSYFGMFNPLQYWVQVQAAAHAVFVAGPRNGLPALAATILQRMGMQFTTNPAVIDRYAKIAGAMGYKPQWFKESYDFMNRNGVKIVSGEYALRSDIADAKILPSLGHRFLEWGMSSFQEGERQGRMTAFNAAFLEWRRANPTAKLDRVAEAKIMNRGMTFYNNMTRAGNSGLEEGAASMPLQFTTWHRRLIDQMWGHELTGAEKARAMIGHSLLYGIPMGVGIGLPWPVYDETRKYLLQKGYDMSDKYMRFLHDGLMGTISSWILGKDYDFSRRAGPSNNPLLRDFVMGDKNFLQVISGPLGSFTASGLKAAFPLYANAYLAVTGGQGSYPLTKDDILDVMKNITSVDNIWKDYYMINFHRYLSRNERILATDASWKDAALLTLFGAQRQDWQDTNLRIANGKEVKAAQLNNQNKAVAELQRYYQALADKDFALADKSIARAKVLIEVLGDFDGKMLAETYAKASASMNEGTLEKARRNYYETGYKKDLPAKMQRLFDVP